MATSISAAVTAVLLWGECDKHLHCGSIIISVRDLLKTSFTAVVAIAVAYVVVQKINFGNFIELIIAALISVIIYCFIGFAIKIELFFVTKGIVKGRFGKKSM